MCILHNILLKRCILHNSWEVEKCKVLENIHRIMRFLFKWYAKDVGLHKEKNTHVQETMSWFIYFVCKDAAVHMFFCIFIIWFKKICIVNDWFIKVCLSILI